MTTTFSEQLRRALRDDLRNLPYRLVRYARGLGPEERVLKPPTEGHLDG